MLRLAAQSDLALRQKIQGRFNQAALHYDQHAMVQKQMIEQLIDRAKPYFSNTSQYALDLGSGTGYLGKILQREQTQTKIMSLDLSLDMLKTQSSCLCVQGDFHELPFRAQSFHEIYSSSALHWAYNTKQVISEITRILIPGGLCALGLFLSGSLCEIQNSWLKTDALPHTMTFLSLSDYLSIFQTAGYSVLESCVINTPLYYESPRAALWSLKKIGSQWHTPITPFITKSKFKQFETHYWQDYGSETQVTLTYVVGLLILKKGNL